MPQRENPLGEALKKAFLIGVGASVVTAEKVSDFVRDVVDDLVDRGEITAIDARKLAYDLKQRAGKGSQGMLSSVETAVQKTVKSLGLVTQSDLTKLKKELGKGSSAPSAKAAKTNGNGNGKKPAAKKPARKPKK